MSDSHPRWPQRVLAVVALGALVGAILVLVVGVISNVDTVILLVIGLIVAVIGGWDSVTRRGRFRWGALILAVVGLGLLAGGLVRADLSLLRTTAVVFLGLVSVISARDALGRGTPAVRPAEDPPTRAVTYTQPVLIMNLKSGGGKAERFGLEAECARRGIEPIVLHPNDDLLQLAEDAINRGADIIGMAGGDGSQALVASVAARHDLPFVVVPAGTRNHFALDLGLDRDDVVGALDAYADGVEHRVDLASVNGRVFVNNATLGVYAQIVQSPEYRNAKRKTAATMLPDILGPSAAGAELRFAEPNGSLHSTADVILVSNNLYELHRLAGRGSRARLNAGVLGVAIATIANANEAAKFVSLELAGQLRRLTGWLEWTASRFEVDADGPVAVGVDGEALSMEPPLVFDTLPAALRVRLPRDAPGRSPAALAMHLVSRSTIVDLARAASGRGSGRRPRGQ
jgi:diacylglycerol kinase family enzyme